MHKDIYIVLMGGDLASGGQELGKESKIRCTKAALIYNKTSIDGCLARFIISAGKMPHCPKQHRPLSIMMGLYLCENLGINNDDALLFNHQATNSAAEIQMAVNTIKEVRDFYEKRGLHSHLKDYEVIIVSSWYHLPRLRFLWWKYAHKNMPKPQFIPAGWRLSMWSLIRELGAWIGALTGWRRPKFAFNYTGPLKSKVTPI